MLPLRKPGSRVGVLLKQVRNTYQVIFVFVRYVDYYFIYFFSIAILGGDRSDVLLKARLDILDNLACTRRYNQSISIPRGVVPSMVCAGDLKNNWQSDTCQADSGGPLQIVHPKIGCLHQLVGITSFGILCAVEDFPGIYTRVSHYLDWIEERVWPETMK